MNSPQSKLNNAPNLVDPNFGNARASVVNRAHRVIRAQALTMREERQKKQSLWVPVVIFSVLMLLMCYAIWFLLDGYDLTPNGVPDASDQMMLFLLWSLPVTAMLLGTVWFKRERGRMGGNGEVTR
jgi:hypothetical protein